MALFGLNFKFQEPPVMLVVVKNQAPQVSFKFIVGDSMSVSSYEFSDINFCESLDILEAISDYGAQAFSLHGLRPPPPPYMTTCTLPYSDT